ncbi:lysozyme inhibitor LprI family protein [Luteibacter sp. NPDC031894]|uniref:lysozyme inhibitor LprI family protein n=1 Tax=Luteibacter sp. NPDC031894 TaxID=3390572 RepID=UPI003CFD67BC
MRKTMGWMVGAPLLLTAGMACAAGFDCGKASNAVEKAICASPKVSALDGQLGEAFRTALKNHPDKSIALKLDQLHWLADRDAAIADFLRDNPGKPLAATVGQYPARIDFLHGLDAKAPEPLDAVQGALSHLPAGSSDVLADLGKAGLPVTVATDVPLDDAKAFPFEPDAGMRKALGALDASSGYRQLAGMPVSSLFSVGGTAHCWTEAPFRIEGKKAIAVVVPSAWDGDCMTMHGMARIGDDIVATVLTNPSADEMNLETSRWDGGKFGPDAQLTLRFDHALSPLGSACAPKQSPCDDFTTAAMAAVARYDRSPVPGTLDRSLKGAAKTDFDAMAAAARAPSGIVPKGGSATYADLPDFGAGFADGEMAGYGPEASLFPIDFRGETLLGVIGHGHVGWRINDDWLISAWRLTGGKLEPVASVYVKVKRGSLLLSAVVPPPPPEAR